MLGSTENWHVATRNDMRLFPFENGSTDGVPAPAPATRRPRAPCRRLPELHIMKLAMLTINVVGDQQLGGLEIITRKQINSTLVNCAR